jgi:hypothetical protein
MRHSKEERLAEWHKEVATAWSKNLGISYETALNIIRSPWKRQIFSFFINHWETLHKNEKG